MQMAPRAGESDEGIMRIEDGEYSESGEILRLYAEG